MSVSDLQKYSIWNWNPIHKSVNPEFETVYFFENYGYNPSAWPRLEEEL